MNYDFSPSHSIQRFTHQRKHQSHHRHHNDNAPDNTVQHPDATQVELCTDFIDKKGNAKPPCQSAQCDGQVSGNGLEYQHSLTYKSEAGEKAYKKEYNQRIGKRDGKRRYEVMKIGTLVDGYRTDGLYRIAAERINAKRQQKNASEKLQVKDVLVDIIKNENSSRSPSAKHMQYRLAKLLSPLRNHTTVLYSKYAEYTILLQDPMARTQ